MVRSNSPQSLPAEKHLEAAERRQLSHCGPFVSSDTEFQKKQRSPLIYKTAVQNASGFTVSSFIRVKGKYLKIVSN